MSSEEAVRPPLPPFTRETALLKVRLAEDGWNSRDPEKVSLAYTLDTRWRNRAEFATSRAEANRWVNNHGVGYVINTSSDEFPNFTPGYHCVVEGPMGQGQAQATARSHRNISPTSYAKSGC